MKKNKLIKILFIITEILFILLIISNFSTVLATDQINLVSPTDTSFKQAISIIIGIFQVVATGVGAIMLVVLAIKYMVSSVGEKAEIKKHAVMYVVGACIAFAATGIVTIIEKFVEDAL